MSIDPIQKVQIANTGAFVTRLGLGGAPFGGVRLGTGDFGDTSSDVAVEVIRRAYALGIRYFDTAPLYGAGRSEVRYGRALEGIDRSKFVMSTKVGRVLELLRGGMTPEESPDGFADHYPVNSWSRDDVLRSIEESLARLRMDQIEIALVHDPDQSESGERQAMEEAFPTLMELKSQSVIKAVGCGMNEWQMPARFIREVGLDIVLLAGRYTLLDHSANSEFMPLCVDRHVSVVIGGPYNSGILARDLSGTVTFDYEPAPAELIDQAKRLKAVCERHGVDLKAAALQYVLAHPAVASVIPGAQSVGELEENIAMIQAEIPDALWADMKSEGLIPPDAVTP